MTCVGIDLGTTNSLVARWTSDGPELIPNAVGERLTPSAVSVANDGSFLIGRAALDRLVTHPERSVAAFKRWMGTNNDAVLAGRTFRAEELSSLVLRSLKQDAEAAFGGEVSRAVISVPAYFSEPQRRATLDAARLAGLQVERLINEPTAAALAHGLETVEEGTFLILDLGGGTFDVSLLHKFDDVMEIRASSGDSRLGGDDFRDRLMELMLATQGGRRGALSSTELAQLARVADTLKLALSASEEAAFKMPFGDARSDHLISRKQFELGCTELIHRLRTPIERVVRDAGIGAAEIDQIVLVGGAARMPLMRKLVGRLFQRLPLVHARPDDVVALGAAVQAGLVVRHAALDDIMVTDVCPFSLGTSAHLDGADEPLYSPIIERNAIVPISRTKSYTPLRVDQKTMILAVLQGENMRPDLNVKLGEVKVDLPPDPLTRKVVEMRFTYDVSGSLEVELRRSWSEQVETRIFRNDSNLTDEQIQARFDGLGKVKLAPRYQAANHVLIARAERQYAELLGSKRHELMVLLNQFLLALQNQQLRDPDRLRADFGNMLDLFEPARFEP